MGDKLSLGVAIYGITTIVFFSSYIREWISWNYVGLFAVFYVLYIGLRMLLQMENEKVQMTIIKCLIGVGGVLGAIRFFMLFLVCVKDNDFEIGAWLIWILFMRSIIRNLIVLM